MHRDCSWRTSLGTCFYDRVSEVEELVKVVEDGWSVLVVGPRNVGKSELVRYALSARLGVKPVIVDARVLVVKGGVERAVREAGGLDKARVAEALARVVAEGLGLGSVVDALLELFRSIRAEPFIVIDEFNYLGDVRTLEALAKMVTFYPEYSRLRLVLTSSEGIMMDYEVLARLTGYRVYTLFVDEMPREEFGMLYDEFCGRGGCKLGLEEYLELVGAFPGYLPEVATLDEEMLEKWLSARRAVLVDVLREAIPRRLGMDWRRVVETAYRLLCEGVEADTPELISVAKMLVRYNVAYPVGYTHRYKPQLKVYKRIVREMYERL